MAIEHSEVVWLEARADYSIDELAEMSGLPSSLLGELLECGVLPTASASPQSTLRFETESIVLARAARRLHEHFELEGSGLAVAVSLLRRVRTLEARLARLARQGRPSDDR